MPDPPAHLHRVDRASPAPDVTHHLLRRSSHPEATEPSLSMEWVPRLSTGTPLFQSESEDPFLQAPGGSRPGLPRRPGTVSESGARNNKSGRRPGIGGPVGSIWRETTLERRCHLISHPGVAVSQRGATPEGLKQHKVALCTALDRDPGHRSGGLSGG